MSLYLKYRPKSFSDVVGQDHIVTTLEHAVERDQLVHAYLFFGPRGTGKTSLARILAKILLIRGVKDEKIQKQIIKSVDEGTLVDLIEIDAATNRQIDDVRDLKEKVQFVPTIASAKIYIIDEVHMMTKEAFNALLKTLEEPPKHAYFILATTELHKVPDTIQSRCQRFPFRLIGDEDIVRCLQNIADKEHITIDRGALRAIARHVNGGMRDAISLLDQLSSLEKVTEDDVRLRIGESAEEEVDNLWEALDAHDRSTVLDIVSSLQEKGVSLEVFLRQMLARSRKELHAAIEAKGDITPITERIDAIFQALKDLRVSPVPSVALEVALVNLCMGEGGAVAKVKKKAEKIAKIAKAAKEVKERRGEEEVHEAKTEEESAPDVKEKDATLVAKELTLETVHAAWQDILSAVPTPSVRMSLKDASVDALEGSSLMLSFASNFHLEKVSNIAARREVEKILMEYFHQTVQIKCVLAGEGESSVPQKHDQNEVNMVDAVAEIFGK